MKIVIFNVSAALSAYVEFGNQRVVIDLGKSNDFSPVNDFLLPLFRKRERDANPLESKQNPEHYRIDQLILSHPHKDHISDIQDFDKYFTPRLLTTPNAKDTDFVQNINWSHIDNPDNEDVLYLKGLINRDRNPPLEECDNLKMTLAYLYPRAVEADTTLDTESYTNNISLAVFIYGKYSILFPGDLQKEGMKALLNGKISNRKGKELKTALKSFGVDFLVAPHHGLQSSFSTDLFSAMKGGKTQKLNIISEKPNTDDNRDVDTRYASTVYCAAENNLSTKDSPVCQRKTSNGHIYIDDNGNVMVEPDINKILEYFN